MKELQKAGAVGHKGGGDPAVLVTSAVPDVFR